MKSYSIICHTLYVPFSVFKQILFGFFLVTLKIPALVKFYLIICHFENSAFNQILSVYLPL